MTQDEYKQMEALLPEYVNGTLNYADTVRLDKALNTSARLRQAFEREKALKNRIVAGTDAMIGNDRPIEDQAPASLMEKTEKEEEAPNGDGLKSALAFLNPRKWHPAITLSLALAVPAQAAFVSVQSVTIASLKDENFRLASGPCTPNKSGNVMLLEFKDGVLWSTVAQLLDEEELLIVSRGDFGVLSVASKNKGKSFEQQLLRLQSSELLSSAEKAN